MFRIKSIASWGRRIIKGVPTTTPPSPPPIPLAAAAAAGAASGSPTVIVKWGSLAAAAGGSYGLAFYCSSALMRQEKKRDDVAVGEKNKDKITEGTIYVDGGMDAIQLGQYRFPNAAVVEDRDGNILCGAVRLLHNNMDKSELRLQTLIKLMVENNRKSKSRENISLLINSIQMMKKAMKQDGSKHCDATLDLLRLLQKGTINDNLGIVVEEVDKTRTRLSNWVKKKYRYKKLCSDMNECELYAIDLGVTLAGGTNTTTPFNPVMIINDNLHAVEKVNRQRDPNSTVESSVLKKIREDLHKAKMHPQFIHQKRKENFLADTMCRYAKTLPNKKIRYFKSEQELAAASDSIAKAIKLNKLHKKTNRTAAEEIDYQTLKTALKSESEAAKANKT